MGELVGVLLGVVLWTWLLTKIAHALGASRLAAVWWGYALTIAAGVAIQLALGGTDSVTLLVAYVVLGALWSSFRAAALRRREEESAPPESPRVTTRTQRGSSLLRLCRWCSAALDVDAEFCAKCGTPVSPRKCAACSTEASDDAVFCKRCGTTLGASASVVPARETAGVKTCPSCGLVNPGSATRCDCGYLLA